MEEGFIINEEKGSDGVFYFTISGKEGAHEYYRMGSFPSKEEAEKQISFMKKDKLKKEGE